MATVRVREDGKAPEGLKVGDKVVTGGGTYEITGVKADGSYSSSLVNNTTTRNYRGSYDPPSGSGSGSSRTTNDTDYSVLIGNAIKDGVNDPDYLQGLLDDRTAKANADPSLSKYANDSFAQQTQAYLNPLRMNQELQEMMEELMYAEEPTYDDGEWDEVLDAVGNELISMNYDDWVNSDQYKALAERYGVQGRMTMQDVLGQINSRTGGLASSYAATAAQQQYNQYMSQLEEIARQMYSGDRADLLENAQVAQSIAQQEYNRHLDEVNQYYQDLAFKYQAYRDKIADQQWQQQFDAQYGNIGGMQVASLSDEPIEYKAPAQIAPLAPKSGISDSEWNRLLRGVMEARRQKNETGLTNLLTQYVDRLSDAQYEELKRYM